MNKIDSILARICLLRYATNKGGSLSEIILSNDCKLQFTDSTLNVCTGAMWREIPYRRLSEFISEYPNLLSELLTSPLFSVMQNAGAWMNRLTGGGTVPELKTVNNIKLSERYVSAVYKITDDDRGYCTMLLSLDESTDTMNNMLLLSADAVILLKEYIKIPCSVCSVTDVITELDISVNNIHDKQLFIKFPNEVYDEGQLREAHAGWTEQHIDNEVLSRIHLACNMIDKELYERIGFLLYVM